LTQKGIRKKHKKIKCRLFVSVCGGNLFWVSTHAILNFDFGITIQYQYLCIIVSTLYINSYQPY
jgi:hypothetical protein